MAEPRPGRAWVVFALALLAAALIGWGLPHEALDWQPSLAWAQPWRSFTAVGVHYSALHLVANSAGAMGVAALGHSARLPLRCTLAWMAAWPLTQGGLLLQPSLLHYGGLSGVLHAGVAIAGVHLVWRGAPRQRRIGAAILAVLLLKLLSETPWRGPLAHPAGWDIAVAPLAHASGVVAGVLCAVIAEALVRRPAKGLSA